MGILSWVFGKKDKTNSASSISRPSGRNKKSGRRNPPRDIDLNSVVYVPLPPSPNTWEVDGREEYNQEFQKEYSDPILQNVFRAGWDGKHTKVIKLASELEPEQLLGQAGEIVAKAYRHVIQKRLKASQLEPAARWAHEMLGKVPTHCTDTDKRRYNKILSELNKGEIKPPYSPVKVNPPKKEPLFVVSQDDWQLGEIEAIPKDRRPDTAFKLESFTLDGALYIDRGGKSELAEDGGCAFKKYDRLGNVVAERSVDHDYYRIGRGPSSTFFAIMDRDGGLHVYNDALAKVLERNLQDDIRVKEHFRSTETSYWGEFRSQVRAVDVNADGTCQLFTIADEAWCCSMGGESIWGVRMPLNEGWERIVGRSNRVSLGAEVQEALHTLELVLPASPQDIKRRYREMARIHHPDRNPGNSEAHGRMQKINEAFEVLTGIDPAAIDFDADESEVTSFRRTKPDDVISVGPIQVSIWLPTGPAQDWVYGASFASHGSGAYLATYSGKVIKVDDAGIPLSVYDLGTVPSQIVELGEYLYLLTATRLYVLNAQSQLVALIDVFQQGKLVITSVGFGLLDEKRLQWFTPSGEKVGEVTSRDPIRALFDSEEGAILETRQHRVAIQGLQLF